jgi:hypothetical protein
LVFDPEDESDIFFQLSQDYAVIAVGNSTQALDIVFVIRSLLAR